MSRLRSTLYMLFLIVTVIPYCFACLLWSPLSRSWRYKLTMGWPGLAIWGARVFCGVRWKVEGAENFPKKPVVVLSKHQSAWETLFFPSHLPQEACFVYKKELHRVPFFGWGLALLDMIAIDRGRGRDAFEQVVRMGKARLAEGRWPLLFPEGTRTRPGEKVRFKMGGAMLAVRAGVDVLPIAHNAGLVWRRNAFVKKPGLITVSVGPPISSEGKTPEALNEEVRLWIETEMRRLDPEHYDQAG